jgi:Tfp pilus assembly protein PilN
MVSFSRSGRDVVEQEAGGVHTLAAPVPASAAAFPRVNLIPDVIAEEVRVRRARLVAAGAVAASVVAVGGLYLMAANDVTAAQEELDLATARAAVLATEAAQYAEVPAVRASVESAKAQQYQAMGGEVRFSLLLNDLALTMPRGSSLTAFRATVTGEAPAVAGATTAAGPAGQEAAAGVSSVLGNPGLGTITYEGEARTYGDVASFLDSLAKQKKLLDPYFSAAALNDADEAAAGATAPATGYTFVATSTVSDVALSHRYDLKEGS